MMKEQTMSTKFTKPVLTISLLASLVTMSATANATISDKRYWPSRVGPSAYDAISTQRAPRDAFAVLGWVQYDDTPSYDDPSRFGGGEALPIKN